jgi:hypothetical protein
LDGLDGVEGLLGAGVLGVDPPVLGEPAEVEPVLEFDEPELVEDPVAAVLAAAVPVFVPGKGLNGSCAAPWCWVEVPSVVSATAVSGVLWLTARADAEGLVLAGTLATVALGVAGLDPPLSTT